MKNLNKTVLGLVVLSCTACCQKGELTGRADAGKVVSVAAVVTAWNDIPRSKIITSKGTFFVSAVASAMHGSDTWITRDSRGRSYFCVDGWDECKRMVGTLGGSS